MLGTVRLKMPFHFLMRTGSSPPPPPSQRDANRWWRGVRCGQGGAQGLDFVAACHGRFLSFACFAFLLLVAFARRIHSRWLVLPLSALCVCVCVCVCVCRFRTDCRCIDRRVQRRTLLPPHRRCVPSASLHRLSSLSLISPSPPSLSLSLLLFSLPQPPKTMSRLSVTEKKPDAVVPTISAPVGELPWRAVFRVFNFGF